MSSDAAPIDPIPGKRILWTYASIALVIHLITAWNSTGYHHADEHFQLLEFASYKADPAHTPENSLAWEFNSRIRPGLQVAFAWIIIKTTEVAGASDPFVVAAILRILSALLTLLALALTYKASIPLLKDRMGHHFFLGCATLLWFMPYLGVRFSSENWGGAFFFIALGWLLVRPKRNLAWISIGSLLGCAFAFRFQTGFLIAGLALWLLIERAAWRERSTYFMLIGFAISSGLSILADHWLYGEWTITAWNYARVNVVEDMASQFGTSPWYYYFIQVLERAYPIMGTLVIASVLLFWWKYRNHPITWASVLFVLAHILVPHKELRFLFPLIFMLPLAFALLAQEIGYTWLKKPIVIALLLLFNVPFLLHKMTSPASDHVQAIEAAYAHHSKGPITLLYSEEDPSDPFGLKFTFYMPEDPYPIEEINDRNDLSQKAIGPVIYFTSELYLHDPGAVPGMKIDLIGQTYRSWITRYLNINGWVERTRMRALYHVEADRK